MNAVSNKQNCISIKYSDTSMLKNEIEKFVEADKGNPIYKVKVNYLTFIMCKVNIITNCFSKTRQWDLKTENAFILKGTPYTHMTKRLNNKSDATGYKLQNRRIWQ